MTQIIQMLLLFIYHHEQLETSLKIEDFFLFK